MSRISRRNEASFGCVVVAAGLLFFVVTVLIFHLIYWAQPTPFLDEVFHIPQAQKYCNGTFQEWDQKITTLPGLYLLSVGILKPITVIFNRNACTVYGLRLVSMVAACINFHLLFCIQRRIRTQRKYNGDELRKDLLSAFNLSMFPVMYFFSSLYYTDVVSTGLVLLCYILYLYNAQSLLTFTATVAVTVRQTNIIWLAFMGQLAVDRVLQEQVVQRWDGVDRTFFQNPQYIHILQRTLRRIWLHDSSAARRDLVRTLWDRTCGFIVVGVGFMVFVYMNDGIVVGDRAAHQICIHIPQLFYYSFFVVTFAFPYVVEYVPAFLQTVFKYRKTTVLIMLLLAYVVQFNTLVHPYLLADNRHYTFYIWKRLYEANFLVKYTLIPVYMFGIFAIYKMLGDSDLFFQTGYLLFTVLCLVPQKLLEFRYFILPFIILRLQYFRRNWLQLYAELCIYTVVNVITLYLFLTRPFTWPDSEDTQHFLW